MRFVASRHPIRAGIVSLSRRRDTPRAAMDPSGARQVLENPAFGAGPPAARVLEHRLQSCWACSPAPAPMSSFATWSPRRPSARCWTSC